MRILDEGGSLRRNGLGGGLDGGKCGGLGLLDGQCGGFCFPGGRGLRFLGGGPGGTGGCGLGCLGGGGLCSLVLGGPGGSGLCGGGFCGLVVCGLGGLVGDLITVEQYSDFEMRFEWKITEYGNSGVIYRIATTEPYPWHTGPEYQVLDNGHHPDGKNAITSSGSNYAVDPPVRDVTKPVGQWNEGRIIVKGNHGEHWLNGVKVFEYEFCSADWQKHVQASKFGKIPPYGTVKRGYIALQDHESVVMYRNLKIKPL